VGAREINPLPGLDGPDYDERRAQVRRTISCHSGSRELEHQEICKPRRSHLTGNAISSVGDSFS
jgi:hypothetical protein